MSKAIERAWQHGHPALYLLAPLMALFALVSQARRWAYRRGWLKSIKLPVPVVVVGNITVGGNGKTPTVLYLVELLKQQGYQPGIISRGYGGKAPYYPFPVTAETDPTLCGDEPALMAQRSGVPVAVGADRIAAAQYLLKHHPIDIVISDDGMQHYRLARDLEVAVIDGERRFGNGFLLPMGPLRESVSRLTRCDLLICNGGTAQTNEHVMRLQPEQWHRVDGHAATPTEPMIAMAGIGYPPRFFNTVVEQGFSLRACHGFADHQAYDVNTLLALTPNNETLVMTEKDAVKCRNFAQPHWFYLPVTASLGSNFDKQFLAKIRGLSDEL